MKLYRILVRTLYPQSFRDDYQDLMEQAFRDELRDTKHPLRLWRKTLFDIVRSAPRLHWEDPMFLKTIAPVFCAIAAALFLARFELRSDDTGVEIGLVLLFTFVLGYWQPKYAWLYSLVGLSIPLAELGWGRVSFRDCVLILLVVTAVSVTGTVCGVFARRLLTGRAAL